VEPWHTARRSEDEWRTLAEDAQRAGAPWAPMLVAALPGLLKLAVTPVPAGASTPILTHCNFGPGCIARLGSGELVVTGWEHAGALPAEWELAVAIMGWSGHARGRADLRTAQALMGGYLAEGGPVRGLGVRAFSSYVCGWLNRTYGQAAMALHVTDREEARVFHRSAADVLAGPLTIDRLESVVTAIGEVSCAPGYA
jgi:hypothetical protein